MKDFLVYTALRIGLFVVTFVVTLEVAHVLFGDSGTVWVSAFVVGAVLSSLLSLKLLNGPRERLARHVDERARRASERFEEMRSREDAD